MRKSPFDTTPERRPLRIFAFDPMLARAGDHRVTIEVPYKPIVRTERSFSDDRLEVVDYDAATKLYYRAVDLGDDKIAMTHGLEPLENDPQFHQQMVYAVASKVLENFDRALGRRLRFRGGDRLRLMPHAFQTRNAYFDEELNAVLFGYFTADDEDPGANLPGQFIFTCLSHDIVAHEVAHAALSRLQSHYNEPTSAQVPALHEAFADIVALFQRMTFPEVVAPALRETRGNVLDPKNRLLDIGAQFGSASGKGGPLRRIAGKPNPELFAKTTEAHDLGWILVSAVFEGFAATYERRTRDLLRIASGGSGRLPDGELQPDLVNRLTVECVRTAQSVLAMCIRATDYLPPVDPTFSDFLRAMVTADFELNRADDSGLRADMIEAFRLRGIRPQAVGSLAVTSLLLESEPAADPPDATLAEIVADLATFGARELGRNTTPLRAKSEKRRRLPKPTFKEYLQSQASTFSAEQALMPGTNVSVPAVESDEADPVLREIAKRLGGWADDTATRQRLGLDLELPVAVRGFHSVHRIAASGELLVELVAHLVQTKKEPAADLGGLKVRAGVTMIANIDGQIRYVVRKPFNPAREELLQQWVARFDEDHGDGWPVNARAPDRLVKAYSARAMDRRRWQ